MIPEMEIDSKEGKLVFYAHFAERLTEAKCERLQIFF